MKMSTYSLSLTQHKAAHSALGSKPSLINLFFPVKHEVVVGWGRKKSGLKASLSGKKALLLEDGFYRSAGLRDAPSYSVVIDDIGIYYDATKPSRLEEIYKDYDFETDVMLMKRATECIEYIRTNKLTKYNVSKKEVTFTKKKSVLVAVQVEGDMSLQYSFSNDLKIADIIAIAAAENPDATIIVKIHPDVISGKKRSDIDQQEILNADIVVLAEDVNVISLLENVDAIYTKSSQVGFEAILLGKKVVTFGAPFYAGWGLTDDRSPFVPDRRNRILTKEQLFAGACILYSKYYDPYINQVVSIEEALESMHAHMLENIKSQEMSSGCIFFVGFSMWKRGFIHRFFPSAKTRYVGKSHTIPSLLGYDISEGDSIVVWGLSEMKELAEFAETNKIHLYRSEDGFVRSSGLGSDLTSPFSLVFDKHGIYYDSSSISKLEMVLNNINLNRYEKQRAKKLIESLVDKKITKYNVGVKIDTPKDVLKKTILVLGQVPGDASLRYGGENLSNLSLLKSASMENPDARIIYKVHPDVVSGNKKETAPAFAFTKLANIILTEGDMISAIEMCDEVYANTSLGGFEALIRGKCVHVYGVPFYAGWDLTIDHHHTRRAGARRLKRLTIEELVYGALIEYPSYFNHISKNVATPEEVIHILSSSQKKKTSGGFINKIKGVFKTLLRAA